MRYLLIFCLLLSGCVTTKTIEIKSIDSDRLSLLQIKKEVGMLAEKKSDEEELLEQCSIEKQCFLKAFKKVGYDLLEVAKLIKDDEKLNIKKFVIKNRRRLLTTGSLGEIVGGPALPHWTRRVVERLIENLELDYEIYLKIYRNKKKQEVYGVHSPLSRQ